MESLEKQVVKEKIRLLQQSCASLRLMCHRAAQGCSWQTIPYRSWSEEISGLGRMSQRKYHGWQERVLTEISAVNSNNLLEANDVHPGVQRQLSYETAQLLSELSKCCLNHHSARVTGKCNQTLKRIQDKRLHFLPYLWPSLGLFSGSWIYVVSLSLVFYLPSASGCSSTPHQTGCAEVLRDSCGHSF